MYCAQPQWVPSLYAIMPCHVITNPYQPQYPLPYQFGAPPYLLCPSRNVFERRFETSCEINLHPQRQNQQFAANQVYAQHAPHAQPHKARSLYVFEPQFEARQSNHVQRNRFRRNRQRVRRCIMSYPQGAGSENGAVIKDLREKLELKTIKPVTSIQVEEHKLKKSEPAPVVK